MARITDWESRIGRRITLRDLHILAAVVRWGSMAKAASHLAMSQSAVSEAIAQLEDAIRVRLLDRTSRGIAPTIYADTLLRRSHVAFDELQQAVKDIEFLADPTAGEVRIGFPEVLSYTLVPAAISQMSRRHPQISVRVVQLTIESFEFQVLQQREVDLVIARMSPASVNDDVEVEALVQDKLMVIVGTQSAWAARPKIELSELVNESWILPPTPYVRTVFAKAFESHGLQPPVERVTAHSIQLRLQLLATGRFISVLADSVLRENAKQWSLKALPIDLAALPPPWSIVRLKNRTLSPVAQLFIEHLREVAKSKPLPSGP